MSEVSENRAGSHALYRLLCCAVSSLDHLLYLVILRSASQLYGKFVKSKGQQQDRPLNNPLGDTIDPLAGQGVSKRVVLK